MTQSKQESPKKSARNERKEQESKTTYQKGCEFEKRQSIAYAEDEEWRRVKLHAAQRTEMMR